MGGLFLLFLKYLLKFQWIDNPRTLEQSNIRQMMITRYDEIRISLQRAFEILVAGGIGFDDGDSELAGCDVSCLDEGFKKSIDPFPVLVVNTPEFGVHQDANDS